MKKKMLLAAAVIVVASLILVFACLRNGITFTSGPCIAASNGRHLILVDNSPVAMHIRSGNINHFEGLETGDKILIINDGINETYPGKTGVYWLFKTGGYEPIPDEVIQTLMEMNWIQKDVVVK